MTILISCKHTCNSISLQKKMTTGSSTSTIISFKAGSSLKEFLDKRTNIRKTFYEIGEVIAVIKRVISDERLYDGRNPVMILCSPELEKVVDCKGFHINQLRERLMCHISFASDYAINLPGAIEPESPTHSEQTKRIANHILSHNNAQFKLTPNFLRIIQSMEPANRTRYTYTFAEAAQLLSNYMTAKRVRLVDERNPKVALVQNDPLGTAFNVSAFHKCQVKALMSTQLSPTQVRRTVRRCNKSSS